MFKDFAKFNKDRLVRNRKVHLIVIVLLIFLFSITIYNQKSWYQYKKTININNEYIANRSVTNILTEIKMNRMERFTGEISSDEYESLQSQYPFQKEYYKNNDFAVIGLAESENGNEFIGGGYRFITFVNLIIVKNTVYNVNQENLYQLIKPTNINQFVDLASLTNTLTPAPCRASNVISVEDRYLKTQHGDKCEERNKYNLAIKFRKNFKGNYEFKYYNVGVEGITEKTIEAISPTKVKYSYEKLLECNS